VRRSGGFFHVYTYTVCMYAISEEEEEEDEEEEGG